MAAVREVVQRSGSVANAIAATRAIDAAWSGVSPATHDAIALMLIILELSETIDDAVAIMAMLRNDGSLLEPLSSIREFVHAEYPGARLNMVPGDEVAASYLDVSIPTSDYPSFWEAQLRLLNWSINAFPGLGRAIQVVPQPALSHV